MEKSVKIFLNKQVDFTDLNSWLTEYMVVATNVLTEGVKLHRELLEAREKLRIPKDKELTDFDRRTMNEAYCAGVQEKYEMIKGLGELLKEKMELVKIIAELG